jgi:hypothetical protein
LALEVNINPHATASTADCLVDLKNGGRSGAEQACRLPEGTVFENSARSSVARERGAQARRERHVDVELKYGRAHEPCLRSDAVDAPLERDFTVVDEPKERVDVERALRVE